MLRPSKIAQRRQHTGDFDADQMQRLAQQVATPANGCPFFSGRRVQGVTFAAGVDQIVNHGLGRRPAGVFVLRDYGTNVCTGVGESTTQPTGMDLTKQISLRSPVACTTDLWVF